MLVSTIATNGFPQVVFSHIYNAKSVSDEKVGTSAAPWESLSYVVVNSARHVVTGERREREREREN